jgi:ectoine hydroxylase-related dioxygenase (phytanoyl-CoA dioxygenase family)
MWQRSIEEQGFAIIPGVLGEEDISRLLDDLAKATLRRSRAGVRHAFKNPAVARLAQDSRLLGIAREVLGSDAFPFRATLFEKSRCTNWLVAWHQDTALPLREKQERPGWGPWSVKDGIVYAHAPAGALSQILALRVHLDDSTAQNGPLRVLPRTHKLGVLSDDEIRHFSAEVSAVDCLTPKGGVLAMRPLVIHSSSKSQAEDSRRVLHIEYSLSPVVANGLELAIA